MASAIFVGITARQTVMTPDEGAILAFYQSI